jgi:hypothetical protein
MELIDSRSLERDPAENRRADFRPPFFGRETRRTAIEARLLLFLIPF